MPDQKIWFATHCFSPVSSEESIWKWDIVIIFFSVGRAKPSILPPLHSGGGLIFYPLLAPDAPCKSFRKPMARR